MLAKKLTISDVSASDALKDVLTDDTVLTFHDVFEKDGTITYVYKTHKGDAVSIQKGADGSESFLFEQGSFKKHNFSKACNKISRKLNVPAGLVVVCGADEWKVKQMIRIRNGLTDGERAVFDSYWNREVTVQAALETVRGRLMEAGVDIDDIGTKNMFRLADFFAC